MKLLRIFQKVKDDEDGAVTVDWVVLTAGLVVFGSAVIANIAPSVKNGGHIISNNIISATTIN